MKTLLALALSSLALTSCATARPPVVDRPFCSDLTACLDQAAAHEVATAQQASVVPSARKAMGLGLQILCFAGTTAAGFLTMGAVSGELCQ